MHPKNGRKPEFPSRWIVFGLIFLNIKAGDALGLDPNISFNWTAQWLEMLLDLAFASVSSGMATVPWYPRAAFLLQFAIASLVDISQFHTGISPTVLIHVSASLQWLKPAFEAHGIYQPWLHSLQGLASHLAYSTKDKSHRSQTGDLAHQGW